MCVAPDKLFGGIAIELLGEIGSCSIRTEGFVSWTNALMGLQPVDVLLLSVHGCCNIEGNSCFLAGGPAIVRDTCFSFGGVD